MSHLGKTVRLRRLFDRNTGKTLILALDHGVGWGVLPGIENMQRTLEVVTEGRPNAVTIMKGPACKLFSKYAGYIPFILKATTFSPFQPTYDAVVGSVAEAIRLGAEAVSIGVTVCGERQAELLGNLGLLIKDAEDVGLPTVSHIYPKGELIRTEDRYSKENVSYAARAAAELGVDIIKTFYTGSCESFAKVVEVASPIPVVVSGGPKLSEVRDVFKMTRDSMDAGASGANYGRNVWQSEDPLLIINILKGIIHHGVGVEDAMKMWKGKWTPSS